MIKETFILCYIWTIMLLSLTFIPKHRRREASVIFMFKLLLTWLFGLLVVEFRLIEYPVRLFSYASRTSFTFEYFVYPVLCVFFNLYYPEAKSRLVKALHYVYYASGITAFEAFFESYTSLIRYINWTWYWTWITLCITMYLSRLYYYWFFKGGKSKGLNSG
jgi:hypothetical protein